MDAATYQKLSERTINRDLSPEELENNLILGLIGEVGEVVDIIKKIQFHKHPADSHREDLIKETGDIFWYLSSFHTINDLNLEKSLQSGDPCLTAALPHEIGILMFNSLHTLINERDRRAAALADFSASLNLLASAFHLDLEEILQKNIQKLERRYPVGFSSEDSLKRR